MTEKKTPIDRRLDRDWTQPVSYPDPAVEVLDPRFRACILGSATLERLWTGGRWAEGPVWFGDGRYLLVSDIPNDQIVRWDEATGETGVFRSPCDYANGNTRDREGRLITCEHDSRRVTRTEHDGTLRVLMDQFDGKPLNSPNDVVVHPDGSVWFTDPGYGILGHYEGHVAPFELPTRVYRFDPQTGEATVVNETLEKPNGLSFSPDYKRLYVVDTGASHKPGHPHHIVVFDVDGQALENERVFCDMGRAMADGIRCDTDGRLWASSGWGGPDSNGVVVFDPDGTRLGMIHTPEIVANLCFGGAKRNRLFIAGSQSIYSIYVAVQGMPYPFET